MPKSGQFTRTVHDRREVVVKRLALEWARQVCQGAPDFSRRSSGTLEAEGPLPPASLAFCASKSCRASASCATRCIRALTRAPNGSPGQFRSQARHDLRGNHSKVGSPIGTSRRHQGSKSEACCKCFNRPSWRVSDWLAPEHTVGPIATLWTLRAPFTRSE